MSQRTSAYPVTARRAATGLLMILLAAWPGLGQQPAGGAQDAPQDTVEINSDLVLVPVSVLHVKGGAVTDLAAGDFALAEDGRQQEISIFNRDTAPVDTVLLVDASGSASATQDVIRRAASRFAKQLRPEDSVSVVMFSDHPTTLLDWSIDKKGVSKAIKELEPGGSTAIYRSIRDVVKERFVGRPDDHRRVIVVLTDGLDTLSRGEDAWRAAADAALGRDITLYVVSTSYALGEVLGEASQRRSLSEPKRAELRRLRGQLGSVDKAMQSLAERTGGRALFPHGDSDLADAYAQISDEISSRYLLGYYSGAADGYHAITVRARREKISLHAREGFYK